MTKQDVGRNAPLLQLAEQRDLDGKQSGLRVSGLVEPGRCLGAFLRKHHIAQRQIQQFVEVAAGLFERGAERRAALQQRPAHAELLRALAREQECQLASITSGFANRHRRMRTALGQRAQCLYRFGCITGRYCGSRGELGAMECGRRNHRMEVDVRMLRQPLAVTARLRTKRGLITARHQQRDRKRGRIICSSCIWGTRRRLFEHHMRIGAADAERRHTCSAHMGGLTRPCPRLLQQRKPAVLPLDLAARLFRMQRLRQNLVPQRQHHLHHAKDTCSRLGMPEVRLRGAQPQRTVRAPRRSEHGSERTRLDGVSKIGAGAVRFDHIDVVGAHTTRRQSRADHALLARAVRRGQPLAAAVLVHGRTADQRPNLVAVTLRVRLALQDQHAAALAPAGAIGSRRERLAATIGRHAVVGSERHERRRRRHHGDAARQRQIALALPQRRAGQMQGRQR